MKKGETQFDVSLSYRFLMTSLNVYILESQASPMRLLSGDSPGG